MKTMNKLFAVAAFAAAALTATAQQQVQQLYFLENAPQRHYLNPAYQLYGNTYVTLPVIGYFQGGVENNSLRLSDWIYQKNSKVGTALTPGFDGRDALFKCLRSRVAASEDIRVEWLGFGHRLDNGGYWHVGLSTRVTSSVVLPRDLFRIGLYGMEEDDHSVADSKTFKLKNLAADMSIYSELSVGYSQPLKNDKWTLGGAVKFLVGHDNMSLRAKQMTLETGMDRWVLDGTMDLRGALPGEIRVDQDGKAEYVEPEKKDDYVQYAKPRGGGLAVDFGFTYRPTNWVEVSGAVTDLGGILWCADKQHVKMKADHITYDGVDAYGVSDRTDLESLLDDELDRIEDQLKCEQAGKGSYFRMLNTHLNAGVDFHTPNNMIGLGLLSTTKLMSGQVFEDVTASINFRPANWFNLSLSHSLVNLKQSCIGAGMALRGGPINLTIATDYVPFSYARESADKKAYIPYKQKGLNVAVGLTLVFGNRKDADRDGVKDMYDLCPNTPKGVKVDSVGCPLDEDKDGVPDYLDQCPGTPAEAVGMVDSLGCPIDSDQDGVPDYKDKCPETPKEAKVDSVGCPLDEDGDGVPDYLDKCPGTPKEAYGKVDADGCPLDTDKDGVPDYLDQCPDTKYGVPVDEKGCASDTDGDGVPDYLDQCPDTKPGTTVNSVGCPLDTDGDGFPDDIDECPTVPGTDKGCPQVTREIRNLFKKAMQGIQFETAKSTIKPVSFPILDQIAQVLEENPTYKVEIQGHTDNVGKPESNKTLSQNRADAVMKYLTDKGIAADRMTAVGYGQDKPIADNATKAGRAKNRRVEFEVSFEEVTYETETIKE